MPLFVFACQACSKEHEVLVRGREKPVCPYCGSKKLTKQVSAFAPMSGGQKSNAADAGCGAQACCRMQGGCGLN